MTTVTSRRGSLPRGSRRAYWRAQVAAHEGSGLSGAAFCRRRGLRKGTLTFWRWTFAQEARGRRRARLRAHPARARAGVTLVRTDAR